MVKGILVNRRSDDLLKSQQLKMEHADLIAEMHTIENLPTHERLQLARLRRSQQLKVARQKEKEWLKVQRSRGNFNAVKSHDTIYHFRSSGPHSDHDHRDRRHISFESSVVLLEAASRNDMEEVAALLERGITPDAANEDGLTALHQCCIDNNNEMLKLLLQFGANVDAQDSDKWTPLHAAATCGHLELVRVLIDHGANLLAVNTDGNMPYDLCDNEETLDFIEAEMSKRGITQELIDETRSATEQQMLGDLMEMAQAAVATGGDLELTDYQGATPLHIAAANGYVRVVEFLLDMHVNVDAVDKDLWTPVHAAACWGHLEVLEMLAQCGADLNAKNKDDETPSNICEDPEIRKRIEQLKTEQESKRLAEAQRRRVRRSQSNNTRAQSVRRTSLRDKTLTTKKDAVEEARLRLQAQEVITTAAAAGDSSSLDLLHMPTANGGAGDASPEALKGSSGGGGGAMSVFSWLTKAGSLGYGSHHNNNTNGSQIEQKLASSSAGGGGADDDNDVVDESSSTAHPTRRPPEGRENDLTLSQTTGSGSAITFENSKGEAVQIQSSNDPANGKINVQVTVLVGAGSGGGSGGVSGGVVGVGGVGKGINNNNNNNNSNSNNNNNNNNNSILNDSSLIVNNQPLSSSADIGSASNNIEGNAADPTTTATQTTTTSTTPNPTFSSVNKFSGVTADMVSDTTSSKRCCTIM